MNEKKGSRFWGRPSECDEGIYPELSLEQLLDRREQVCDILDELETELSSIQDQIAVAREERELTAQPVDAVWLGKAMAARRGYTRVRREHEYTRKSLTRRIMALRHKSEVQAFIKTAQLMPEPAVYHTIWARARQEAAGGAGV